MECDTPSQKINGEPSNGLETEVSINSSCDDASRLKTNGSPGLKEETNSPPLQHLQMSYDFTNVQKLVEASEFSAESCVNNILRGCKWAPDGTCVLTNSSDNALRLFNLPSELYQTNDSDQNLPPLESVLKTQEGGLIYDFCWYPLMSSWEPSTCCFLSTSAKSPVHLWDAYSSKLRATYRIYDNADEVISATSLNFSPSGDQIYCGLKNLLTVFDTAIPGREYSSLRMKEMKGIISCIAFSPVSHQIMAAGTYTKSVGLFSLDDDSLMCTLNGHRGGLTHLIFSPDGSKLYSGARKDDEILCWDLRNPGSVLFSLIRTVDTNQRIYFDLTPDGKYLISGGTDGFVKVWDTTQPMTETDGEKSVSPFCQFEAHRDCTNGVSLNNHQGILATASGQHHIDANSHHLVEDSESDDDCGYLKIKQEPENSLKLWRVGSFRNLSL